MLPNDLKKIKLNINSRTSIIDNDLNPWLALLKISVEMAFCGSSNLDFAFLNLMEKNIIMKINIKNASISKSILCIPNAPR